MNEAVAFEAAAAAAPAIHQRYRGVRAATEALARPLTAEDCAVQSMPDASPTKWHLAHTTWFFETFVLERGVRGFRPFDPSYRVLFNSYYNQVGAQHPRPARGLLSRPSLPEVMRYREHVDRAMQALLAQPDPGAVTGMLVELGLHHEQQHQELILTDIKHAFATQPLRPAYATALPSAPRATRAPELRKWVSFDRAIATIGHAGHGFCFDNEQPVHEVLLQPYALASHPVTFGEYLAFVEDDGYQRPELWLSAGWDALRAQGWTAPAYCERLDGRWMAATLRGVVAVDLDAPVVHVSYFEADAFARWAHARLPTEFEWEHAATAYGLSPAASDNLLDGDPAHSPLHPRPCVEVRAGTPAQMFGDVWEWTSSSYAPYPGFRVAPGAVGEYNGKFMCNQFVLRGGACVTPRGHVRASYRNFFPPEARWQFTGLRLARDLH